MTSLLDPALRHVLDLRLELSLSVAASIATHLTEAAHTKWNEVVMKSEDGRFSHSFEWNKVLEEYGLATKAFSSRHIIAVDEETGEVIAVFPIFLDKGKRLASPPYGDYGGPCLVPGLKENLIVDLLLEKVQEMAREEAHSLEIRSVPDRYLASFEKHGFTKRPFAYTFLLPLQEPVQNIVAKLRRDVRRGIKKAEKAGIETEEIRHPEVMKEYYELHEKTMRHLRASARPPVFFDILWKTLAPTGHLCALCARYHGRFIAGLISVSWKSTLHIYSNVSSPEHLNLHANDLLYLTAIEWAADRGHRVVDYGLTPLDQRSGLYQYKAKWGASPTLLFMTERDYRPALLRHVSRLVKLLRTG